MVQQSMYPSASTEQQQIESKIMLLYLIDKMDIPLSNSQISQFALEENYLNYYKVQLYLSEMVQIGYLDQSQDNNTTRYAITEEGMQALEAFLHYIPSPIRARISKYVTENRKNVKQEFEIVANHFYEFDKNEYIVKCGVYEDDMMLMELNLSVVSKEQALTICNNWKGNVNNLYGQIINILLSKRAASETPEGVPAPDNAPAEA